jgi:hypothetical protein
MFCRYILRFSDNMSVEKSELQLEEQVCLFLVSSYINYL